VSSKLQDIRQAYSKCISISASTLHDKSGYAELEMLCIRALPDLLAIAEAAQAMRAEIKNIPQTVMTYHMYDVVADYDKAAAKLEGE